MSYRKYEIIDYTPPTLPSPFFVTETTSSFFPILPFSSFPTHDLTSFSVDPFFPDLIETTYRVVKKKVSPSDLYLMSISDRVSSLESKLDRLLVLKEKEAFWAREKLKEADRKYTWTAEIKGGKGGERKHKWTAEIEGGKKGERKYQYSTEIKGKDDGDDRIYTWKATIGGDKKDGKKDKKGKDGKKEKKSEKQACMARIVEIEEPVGDDHRSVVLRQAFARRASHGKGEKKEIEPIDAVVLIQRTFRAYLIRRSQILRALRELAIAKTKLKELRASFHNFSFRSRISRDAEERQKFSEKIIVLLLTVDSIEGVDMMVRAAKRSVVDELEAMLDVVDPQKPGSGRSLSMRRRTFDMPSGVIQKEIAEGVAQVVQMLDEDNETFEASV